jgi:hypothetical protein
MITYSTPSRCSRLVLESVFSLSVTIRRDGVQKQGGKCPTRRRRSHSTTTQGRQDGRVRITQEEEREEEDDDEVHQEDHLLRERHFFLFAEVLLQEKRRLNKTTIKHLLIIPTFLTIPMPICFLLLFASLLTLMGRTIHGGLIKCVVIFFVSTLAFGMS